MYHFVLSAVLFPLFLSCFFGVLDNFQLVPYVKWSHVSMGAFCWSVGVLASYRFDSYQRRTFTHEQRLYGTLFAFSFACLLLAGAYYATNSSNPQHFLWMIPGKVLGCFIVGVCPRQT